MIEIHKIDDSAVKAHFSDKYSLSNTYEYFGVFDGGDVLEFSVYTVNEKTLEIIYISDIQGDFSLIHGLLKSILFVADLKSIDSVSMPLNYERAAKAIGFRSDGEKYTLRLEDYHSSCESNKV